MGDHLEGTGIEFIVHEEGAQIAIELERSRELFESILQTLMRHSTHEDINMAGACLFEGERRATFLPDTVFLEDLVKALDAFQGRVLYEIGKQAVFGKKP